MCGKDNLDSEVKLCRMVIERSSREKIMYRYKPYFAECWRDGVQDTSRLRTLMR